MYVFLQKKAGIMQNIKVLPAPVISTEQELLNIDAFIKDSDPLLEKAYEHLSMEEYREAFELFSFAASVDSTDSEILNGLGVTLCEMGRLDDALQILFRSIRLNGDDVLTCANIAAVYWEMDEFKKALYFYRKAIDLDPSIPEPYYNMINLYIDMDCLYAALVSCLDFCRKFPDDEEGAELMREILINLGIFLY